MQTDDAQRIVRLSEEIRGRLQEIGMIVNRTAGVDSPKGHVARFVARDAGLRLETRTDAGADDWVEIIEVDGVEACYGVIDGRPFAESPCGASG
jgi:hypothetical protein